MRRRLTPFAANCDAAIVLRRLAASSGDAEFASVADSTLAAMCRLAMAQGPHAAHYVLARRAARVAVIHSDSWAVSLISRRQAPLFSRVSWLRQRSGPREFSTGHSSRYERNLCSGSSQRCDAASNRLGAIDERSGQRSSDDVPVGRRDRRHAVLRARCATTRKDPQNPDNDRFVLSKGHAAPILYAAWAEAGLFPREELLKLRRIDIGSGGASDAAAVVRRRRHRLARSGDLRRDRHRAQRAPDRVRLPDLRAARRRRDG